MSYEARDDTSIHVECLSKCYRIYDKPNDRLKQMIIPRLRALAGRQNRVRYYREFWALEDVSFTVRRGETIGIIGRNGSGKSTLLQLICGIVAPTSGEVEKQGRVAALLELGSGFSPDFTGRENVYLNAAVLGLDRAEISERFDRIAAFADIGEFIDQPVKTYSSGMQARLAFAVAINVDPDILIVDEALAVGDARFVAKCMRRIKDIQESGATVLFVSHDIASVRTLCQRAIWLDQGRIREDGDVFPVTGRFMEQMCAGEISTDEPGEREADGSNPDVLNIGPGRDGTKIETAAVAASAVTHWGSHKGIVQSAAVCNVQGEKRDLVHWGQPISIVVDLVLPLDIPEERLGIAFSIKDLKGTDLVVSSTAENMSLAIPKEESLRVIFTLKNHLVSGKYLLVVAVENRMNKDIHYYEYIEGVQYFSSVADTDFCGLFHPEIEHEMVVIK